MEKKFLLLLVAFSLISSLFSQKMYTGIEAHQIVPGARFIRYVERSIYPNHIIFTNKPIEIADHGSWIKSLLKLPTEYSLIPNKQETDNIGFVHQEYKQLYKGIPVEYGVYKAHYKNDQLQSVNGDIYEISNINTNPGISETMAIDLAKEYLPAQKYKWEEGKFKSSEFFPEAELMILPYKNQCYLTYKVDIYSVEPLNRKYIYVDAIDGDIITSIERIHDVDTPGTANTVYSGVRPIVSDYQGLYYWIFGIEYALNDTTRGLTTLNYSTNQPYANTNPNWIYSGQDQYALDAHWGSEMTYDYYYNTYGQDGLDGAGYSLSSYVNEGPGLGNAFWDGTECHYGDGDGITFLSPLTSIGVVAHEMTHGVTEFSANLVYFDESGALNESFSDIFGVAVDHYARNVDLNLSSNWLVSAECTGGIGIRSLQDPNLFNNPDTYQGTFWNGAPDIVHCNSGVQNFWFYLLTMGGSGTNDNSDSYSVMGIGIDNAAAISYRNLVYYLTPACDFNDSRFYSIQAAGDLFGICSPEVESTTNAWYAVGVGAPYQNITTSAFSFHGPLSCTLPMEVTFTNFSINAATYLWDFGDGDTSTAQHPSHFYNTAGNYTVQLIVTGCGTNLTDTFSTNVVISPGIVVVNMVPSATQDLSCCYGTLYDSGGPLGNYTQHELSYASIVVPVGNIVEASFASFHLQDLSHYLKIYDGPDQSYPLIGSFTGLNIPNGGVPVYSSSNTLFIEFDSFFDAGSDDGFEMNWHCEAPSIPTSSFISNGIDVCAGTQVTYTNTSSNGSAVSWDFQGGMPNISTNYIDWVNYNTPGVYTTTLITYNAFGSDTSTSTITVYPLPTPTILVSGNLLQVSPSFDSYQWYGASLIPGATSQTYLITSGLESYYYCEVIDSNGCTATTPLIINTFSLDEGDAPALFVYPNPTADQLWIEYPTFDNDNYTIYLMNMLGEILFSVQENHSKSFIDLATIASGAYFLQVRQGDWYTTIKIMVTR